MTICVSKWFKLGLIVLLTFSFIVACSGTNSQTSQPNSSASPSAECRTIQHKAGETCVPNDLQRVVVLDRGLLANAIALGVQPVGSVRKATVSSFEFPVYLQSKVNDSLESVGTQTQPNLEKILQLQPDLILGFNFGIDYDKLSQIASTVIIEWQDTAHWKEHFQIAAEAMGKSEKAEQLLANYHRRIEELKAAIESPEELEISLAYIGGNTPFIRSDVKNSFPGSILEDVGLGRPPSQDIVHRNHQIEVSQEMIPSLDGDVLFLFSVNDEQGKETWNKLKNHPIWQKLDVVKNEQVYLVDFETWRMHNILAANGVIDDLFKYLVERKVERVN